MTDAASHGALTALYTAALGHGPKERYLRRFAQFDAAGRTSPGWNGTASLCTLGWAALRHLWVPALLYVAVLEGLALLALGPGRWLLPQAALLPALLAIVALAWVLPGMYGDALLHTEMRKRIVTALTQTRSVAEACIFLEQRASTPQRLQKLILAHAAVAVVIATGTALSVWQPGNHAPLSAATQPASSAATGPTGPELTVEEALAQTSSAATLAADALPVPEPTPTAAVEVPVTEPPGTLVAAKDEATPSARVPTAALKTKPSAGSAKTALEQPQPARSPEAPARAAPPPAPPNPLRAASTSKDTVATEPGSQPGYYLNAGLFAEEANARKVQAELLNANLPAFRQSLQTAQGQRIRVRVGPFATLRQAQSQSNTLRGMGLEAVVFRIQGN